MWFIFSPYFTSMYLGLIYLDKARPMSMFAGAIFLHDGILLPITPENKM